MLKRWKGFREVEIRIIQLHPSFEKEPLNRGKIFEYSAETRGEIQAALPTEEQQATALSVD